MPTNSTQRQIILNDRLFQLTQVNDKLFQLTQGNDKLFQLTQVNDYSN